MRTISQIAVAAQRQSSTTLISVLFAAVITIDLIVRNGAFA